ncbi:MAG: DUF4349 domain-containing protein [Candidatus Roizmanbacteria bacterium]
MLQNVLTWIRSNKLLVLAVLVILYLLRNSFAGPVLYSSRALSDVATIQNSGSYGYGMAKMAPDSYIQPVSPESVGSGNPRMVSRDASMSIVVSKVSETQAQMIVLAERAGGFMVSSSVSSPTESPTGNFVVRVPSTKLNEIMLAYRQMGVKVASEQVTGVDITDQYMDIQARLAPLRDTFAQFDKLRKETGTIEEKMSLLTQLQNIQGQIDALVGQQKYLESTSATSRISVYLSADEFDLPYAPAESWRPEVIFKQSVRDLVTTLRGFATTLISVVVYSVIWLPLLIIGFFVYRRLLKPKV